MQAKLVISEARRPKSCRIPEALFSSEICRGLSSREGLPLAHDVLNIGQMSFHDFNSLQPAQLVNLVFLKADRASNLIFH